jgi:HAD superfamily hydrolase (TIGR01484 family)
VAMRIVPNDSRCPFLLAADIDGTLLGETREQSWLCDFLTRYPASMYLAYMTGRSVPSVRSLIDTKILPTPHFVCSHVGTELFDYRYGGTALHDRFAAAVDPALWDLDAVYERGVGKGIQRQVFTNGRPPFHAGFFWDGSDAALAAFRQRLAPCVSCSIVVSHGMFIDVIPTALGKGNAVRFLKDYLEIAGDAVVVAGDSGNDMSMFATPFNAIVPANSFTELKTQAAKPWHYHSPHEAGEGVLDGLCYFGFIQREHEAAGLS